MMRGRPRKIAGSGQVAAGSTVDQLSVGDQDPGAREQLRPCPFCGGGPVWDYYTVGVWDESEDRWKVTCDTCGITFEEGFKTRKEAFEAWNRRAERTEQTAKVIEHDASVTVTDGYKYHRSEYLCGACKKKVIGGDEYCSHCGCRLDWNEDIPMEYFESGGR